MSDDGEDNHSNPMNDGGSSTMSAGSNGEGGPEDIAKRRSKNRVNARRSRERKRLMMDTLQQEHWKLHQENKRIRLDNDKLREVIVALKALQGRGNAAPVASPGAPQADQSFPPRMSNQGIVNMPNSSGEGSSNISTNIQQQNAAPGNPLMSLLLQQLLVQPQGVGGTSPGGMNPILMLLMAQVLQQQNQIPQGSFDPIMNSMGNMGVAFNPLLNTMGNVGGMVVPQQQQPENQQQSSMTNTGNSLQVQQPQQQQASQISASDKIESRNATNINNHANQPSVVAPTLAAILQQMGVLGPPTINPGVTSLLHSLGNPGIAPQPPTNASSNSVSTPAAPEYK